MRAHVWGEGGYGMVTGCDDPEQAVALLADELAERDDWFLWAGDPVAEATAALREADVRVERGRIVPNSPEMADACGYVWSWWPNPDAEGRGVTTAVVFYERRVR